MAEKNLFDNEILAELGNICLKLNNKPLSLHSFGQSFALDKTNTNVLIGLGSIFQEFSDFDAALKKYSNCNFQNPNSAELWNNIGMCFYGKEQHISVRKFFLAKKIFRRFLV